MAAISERNVCLSISFPKDMELLGQKPRLCGTEYYVLGEKEVLFQVFVRQSQDLLTLVKRFFDGSQKVLSL